MKAIPRNQLIVMLMNAWDEDQSVFEDSIIKLFNEFGDEWYYEGDTCELCVNREGLRHAEFSVKKEE